MLLHLLGILMHVKKINGIIPFTYKKINITLNSNDLIITGKNGSGKTQLLDTIFSVLTNAKKYKFQFLKYIKNQKAQKISLEINLTDTKTDFENNKKSFQVQIETIKSNLSKLNSRLVSIPTASQKAQLISRIGQNEKQLEILKKNIAPETLQVRIDRLKTLFNNQQKQQKQSLDQFLTFKQSNKNNKVIKHIDVDYETAEIDSENNLELILFFAANRVSTFQSVQNIGSLEQEKQQIKAQSTQGKNSNAGSLIERFLANWEVKSALREKKNDYSVTEELTEWKAQFVKSLRVLLDDDSTDIEFNDDTLNYEVMQEGKERFSFRDLSSGYSAILKVFVELLMQTEVSEYSPHSISGYVIIDEIDVHLHASLQRKVLPFLSSLFPKVQFIVSTHSPFVLMSVKDAVIFDMETNAQIEEDLSSYSYSAVLEGVLGIKPTSLILENTISKLAEIVNSEHIDPEKLEQLINTVEPLSDNLNNREKSFYLKAVNALADMNDE
jgi:predicted ATP-binding protein involved in virulence